MVVGRLTEQRIVPLSGVRCLVGAGAACWVLVATMRYWWRWLWQHTGLVSVPVVILVWVVAIVLTVLAVPALLRRFQDGRFHHVGVIVFVVGALVVGGTAVVLSPWHDVLARAGLNTLDSHDLGSAAAEVMVEPRL